ncbi:MAG: Smr/MutS family protein, partial [Roseovarius sp.]|nr:Smr/MutS family protein [Roseovarius sp.]
AVLPGDFGIGRDAPAGGARDDLLPGIAERVAAAPLRMDQKAHARLRRGKLRPEARIDLHGMTLDRARPALIAFVLESHARERRLVLVITGKGKHGDDRGPIPMRPGALRHHVPVWLQAPPAAQVVLQVVQAHVRHGGEGAYYVYLRRRRQ